MHALECGIIFCQRRARASHTEEFSVAGANLVKTSELRKKFGTYVHIVVPLQAKTFLADVGSQYLDGRKLPNTEKSKFILKENSITILIIK